MARQSIVRVRGDSVMASSALPIRIDVNRHTTEVWEVMQQLMPNVSGDVVAF